MGLAKRVIRQATRLGRVLWRLVQSHRERTLDQAAAASTVGKARAASLRRGVVRSI